MLFKKMLLTQLINKAGKIVGINADENNVKLAGTHADKTADKKY